MEQDIEKRIKRIEDKIEVYDKYFIDIKVDIREIRTMLTERLEQENLKNQILQKDIEAQKERIEKLEDNQKWLWRTVGVSVLGIIVSAITYVLNIMR